MEFCKTLRPKQNGAWFADNIIIRIFSDENFQMSFKISLRYFIQSNWKKSTLVLVMAWCWTGNILLTEPMAVSEMNIFKYYLVNPNTLRLRQNGCHLTDNIFKCIFLIENGWIVIDISLKFVPKGPINNISALVQIMAWRQPGDKPLFEPMMV